MLLPISESCTWQSSGAEPIADANQAIYISGSAYIEGTFSKTYMRILIVLYNKTD